jgi:membrane associated rhomboid family serine protease
MGIYDRDYYRSSAPPRFGQFPMMSVTMWLIVINFAVAMIDSILVHVLKLAYVLVLPWGSLSFPPLQWWGHFSVATAIFEFQIWRFITFQFLHGGIWHLVFNMLMLYFFGPLVESYLGRRRFLAFYLLSGIAGPFGYMLLWALSNATPMSLIVESHIPLIGASAGLFGILVASAHIAPDATVLIWGILPMKLRALAWVMLAIAVYTVFTMGYNAGGEAAHLGGAVLGWLLIRNPQWLNFADRLSARRRFSVR